MMYELPTHIEVGGADYEIRSDYRAALDILSALSDPDLDEYNRVMEALDIFYPAFGDMPQEDYRAAIEKCFWFINCGDEATPTRKAPKLMDWEQDFAYVVAPINRVLGKEVRSVEYLHWWTFIGAYYEVGDCLFAQIVNIRNKKSAGKKLDKSEQEFYRKNRHLVDFKQKYTKADDEILNQWLGK